MKKIALVTDSTADLTKELKEKYDIHTVSLNIKFDDQEYSDEELTSDQFYRRLKKAKKLPTTSQPSPKQFNLLYNKLLEDHHEIISIHLSSGLSGTLNAANLARKGLKGKVHLIDSKNISVGIGLLVIEAAKNIKEGLCISRIIDKISKARDNIEMLFTLNTLEYLQKGGRIGKVQGFMGTLLNIKPIIRVGDDGIYHTYGKVRGQRKAIDGIVQAFRKLSKGRKRIRLAVSHGSAEQVGLQLKEALEDAFQLKTTLFSQVGPVIGVHTGPGAIGAAIQFE